MGTKLINHLAFFLVALLTIMAHADDPTNQASDSADSVLIEEIVVTASTGSFIDREIQVQPIPVINYSRENLTRSGLPSFARFIENNVHSPTPYIRRDHFGYGEQVGGLKTINLRGLGAHRNLVLLNDRRLAAFPGQYDKQEPSTAEAVDLANIPSIAVSNIEILTNGGAVTYGSDAISGVVNLKTRDYFNGLTIDLSHQTYSNDVGDKSLAMLWGKPLPNGHVVFAFEREVRGEYSVRDLDRDRPDFTLGFGLWDRGAALGNPGRYFLPESANMFAGDTSIADPMCGSVDTAYGTDEPDCRSNHALYWSLVEPESRNKIFGSGEFLVGDKLSFNIEVLHSTLESVKRDTPSYIPWNEGAGESAALRFLNVVPLENPGLIDILDKLDSSLASDFMDQGSALFFGLAKGSGYPSASFPSKSDATRIAFTALYDPTELLQIEASAVQSITSSKSVESDIISENFRRALHGVAGEDCPVDDLTYRDEIYDPIRGNASLGCFWYSPSGASINAAPGSALYNDPAMFEYLLGTRSISNKNSLTVFDVNATGEITELFGMRYVPWMLGLEHLRIDGDRKAYGDNICTEGCGSQWQYLPAIVPGSFGTKRVSLRGETVLPIVRERVSMDLGFRYEDFDANRAFTPKIALLARLSSQISVRTSFQKVTRLPTVTSGNSPTGGFPVNLGPNESTDATWVTLRQKPSDELEAETSDNFSLGLIVHPSKSQILSVDFFHMDFSGSLAPEDPGCECAEKFIRDGTAYDPLFHPRSKLATVEVDLINSDQANEISGLDIGYDLRMPLFNVQDGLELLADLNATWFLKYEADSLPSTSDVNSAIQSGRLDLKGTYSDGAHRDASIVHRALPEFRARTTLSLKGNSFMLSAEHHYISDTRVLERFDVPSTQFPRVRRFSSWDLHYTRKLSEKADVMFSVLNALDEDSPVAPTLMAIDPNGANPLGRIFEMKFSYSS